MTRLVLISDTHLQHDFAVPDGDILIHAGDLTFRGNEDEVARAAAWLRGMPHAHIVAIAGNHDLGFQRDPEKFRGLMRGITYLEDSEATVAGLRIYGSPYQPEFCNWAFNLDRMTGELAEKWAAIPDGLDVLVTHGPPQGILDVPGGQDESFVRRVGCHDLRARLVAMGGAAPAVHVFGHIHHSYGAAGWADGRTLFVNASTCDENYRPTHKPIVVDLEPGGIARIVE